jgi:hypothetical protein
MKEGELEKSVEESSFEVLKLRWFLKKVKSSTFLSILI